MGVGQITLDLSYRGPWGLGNLLSHLSSRPRSPGFRLCGDLPFVVSSLNLAPANACHELPVTRPPRPTNRDAQPASLPACRPASPGRVDGNREPTATGRMREGGRGRGRETRGGREVTRGEVTCSVHATCDAQYDAHHAPVDMLPSRSGQLVFMHVDAWHGTMRTMQALGGACQLGRDPAAQLRRLPTQLWNAARLHDRLLALLAGGRVSHRPACVLMVVWARGMACASAGLGSSQGSQSIYVIHHSHAHWHSHPHSHLTSSHTDEQSSFSSPHPLPALAASLLLGSISFVLLSCSNKKHLESIREPDGLVTSHLPQSLLTSQVSRQCRRYPPSYTHRYKLDLHLQKLVASSHSVPT